MHHGRSIHIASGERTLVAIDGFTVVPQQITILLGESGIGKSLLAKALYGILDPEELTVTIDGMPYEEYCARSETQQLQAESFFVFQEPSTHLNPLMTLHEQLNEGSLAAAPHQAEILRRLWCAFADEDVSALLRLYPKPYRPSGGEKQRMLLAMAFKKMDAIIKAGKGRNSFFVFDEPSGNLDNTYRDVFLEMLFDRYRAAPMTILIITHDYSTIGTIYQHHADVLPRINFRELRLAGELRLRTFAPKDYLRWLEQLRPLVHTSREPVLTVEHEVHVHRRLLRITRDPEGKESCPLIIPRGGLVYLKAGSGVGKTTLVKTIMGLVRPQRMKARVAGQELDERTPLHVWRKHLWGKMMTLVFQHADEALNLESSVRGLFAGLPIWRKRTPPSLENVLSDLLKEASVSSFLEKRVKHLSGGQKQRLNLLRGMCLETPLLILDEPLNGLDFESAGKVIDMMQRKQEEGKAILLISHNEEIFDRIVLKDDIYYLHAIMTTQSSESLS